MTAWLDRLGERSRPHFGQLTLAVLLVSGLSFALYFQTFRLEPIVRGERASPVTFLSPLPEAFLLSHAAFVLFGVLFAVGAFLWAIQAFLPWSSWLASLSFLVMMGLHHENAIQCNHTAHATSMLLLIHALWYHFYAGEIRAARRAGRFWSTPLYPRWVHFLGVFYLGLFYGLSGIAKLWNSGPGWANGLSLQLWTNLWGDPASVWTHLILASRPVAFALQASTLFGETAALPAVFFPRLRIVVALTLIGFHYGAICVFGWGFHANAILLGLFFLPFDRWIPRLVDLLERRTAAVPDALPSQDGFTAPDALPG